MDLTLPGTLIQFAGCIATLIANIIVISIATKWFAIAIPFLVIVYTIIQRLYIPTARELQRIESITRSPIYSKFGEALNGVATIRAYRKEGHFTKVGRERQSEAPSPTLHACLSTCLPAALMRPGCRHAC
jgi:ATP-binding cassette subfamily C (CFTR/MRP) protein 1